METTLPSSQRPELDRYITLKLTAIGEATDSAAFDDDFIRLTRPMLQNHYQKDELLGWPLCPADARIQAYLEDVLHDVCPSGVPRLPGRTLVLDGQAMADAADAARVTLVGRPLGEQARG